MSTLKPDIMVNPSDLFIQTSNTTGTVPYTTQVPDLGARAVTGDGREFRYVQAGASNLIAGQVQQSPALSTNLIGVTAVAAAVGATTITLTISTGTAITAGQFSGGTFNTYGTVANGGGQCLQISTNTAVSASGTSITFTLADPVQVAITTSANVTIVPLPFLGVIQFPANTATGTAVGVALGTAGNASTATTNGLTASYYGWLQVKGISNVLIQGTPATGVGLAAPATAAGALAVVSGTTSAPNAQIATNLYTGTDGRYGPVNLFIS